MDLRGIDGLSYDPYLSEDNQISVINELVDASLKPVMTLNTSVSTEGKDIVRWQTASSDLSELPDGCSFAARCNQCTDRCSSLMPQMAEPKQGHRVRCHLYSM